MKLLKTLVTGAALVVGLAGSALAEDKLKVGFIYIGPTGDFGWSYEHDQGRKAIVAALGDKVETTFVESVPESADSERVMTQMAITGHDMIFATSFNYMDHVLNVAKKFPNVKFEHATGFKRADNVSTYSARFYEGRTVIGHIAGNMTKTNTIGYIASFPIPEVIRGINAAYLAAKAVNPDVKLKIVWVNTWFDPGKEADAATALIAQGADVIMQHTDSPAAMTIAEEKGIFAFGQASDMVQFGPNARLSSIIDNWGPYYVSRVQAALDGKWASTDTWDGIKPGMVEIGKFSDKVPADVQASATAIKDAIVAGTQHSFTGPINKQDGSAWLAEGETADDGTLATMNFYVEGIEDAFPK